MSDLEVITYRPTAGEYAWTFGGAAPVMRLRTPCVLDLFTEDCFAGRVQSAADLVTRLNITGLNPQTGPFWIEGAEPGDTVAVHFVSLTPARDWAASTTVPLFGALTGTHLTALLQEPLEEVTWIWQLDRDRRLCGPRSSRTLSAGTWTPRRCAREPRATSASTYPAPCCRSATGTPARARARPAASPSSAR
jgi:hypothetical protein